MNLIRTAATSAAMRVAESLDVQAQSATRAAERELIFNAMQELRRNLGMFQGAFHETLRERVAKDLAPQVDHKRKLESADWESLSLVDVQEVETQMNHVRLGQLISHECDWQLRDLAAYMGSLLSLGRADDERNPLRAEIIGAALNRGIEVDLGRPRPSPHLHPRARAERGPGDARVLLADHQDAAGARHPAGAPDGAHGRGTGQPDVRRRQLGLRDPAARRPQLHPQRPRRSRRGLRRRATSTSWPRIDVPWPPPSPAGHRRTASATRMPAPHGPSSRGGRGNTGADQQLMALLRRLTAVSPADELGPVGLLGRPVGGAAAASAAATAGGGGGGGFGGGGGGGFGGGGAAAAIRAVAAGRLRRRRIPGRWRRLPRKRRLRPFRRAGPWRRAGRLRRHRLRRRPARGLRSRQRRPAGARGGNLAQCADHRR